MYLTVIVLSQNYFKEKPQVGEWKRVVEKTEVPIGRIVNTLFSVKRIGLRIREGGIQKPNKKHYQSDHLHFVPVLSLQ